MVLGGVGAVRNLPKIKSQKSMYLSLCNLQKGLGSIDIWIYQYQTMPNHPLKPLRYSFETCNFRWVGFMAKSGSEIAPNFVPILWISQLCPNRCYSQCICLFYAKPRPQHVDIRDILFSMMAKICILSWLVIYISELNVPSWFFY